MAESAVYKTLLAQPKGVEVTKIKKMRIQTIISNQLHRCQQHLDP